MVPKEEWFHGLGFLRFPVEHTLDLLRAFRKKECISDVLPIADPVASCFNSN